MERLPIEICIYILNFLNDEDLIVCQYVSRRFKDIVAIKQLNESFIIKCIHLMDIKHTQCYIAERVHIKYAYMCIRRYFTNMTLNQLWCTEYVPSLKLVKKTFDDLCANTKYELPLSKYLVNASNIIIHCRLYNDIMNDNSKLSFKYITHSAGHAYCRKKNKNYSLDYSLCHLCNLHNVYVVIYCLMVIIDNQEIKPHNMYMHQIKEFIIKLNNRYL